MRVLLLRQLAGVHLCILEAEGGSPFRTANLPPPFALGIAHAQRGCEADLIRQHHFFSPTSPFGPHTLLLQIVKYTFSMVALDLDDAFFDRTAGTAHHFELLTHQC